MARSPKIVIDDPEQFYKDFPQLTTANHRPTSPATDEYNCVGLAIKDVDNWWWPKSYPDARMGARPVQWMLPYDADETRRESIVEMLKALATRGFSPCENGEIEAHLEKIAIFGVGERVTHIATLPRNRHGRWKSKMGDNVDIEHELRAVEGPPYGIFLMFLSRSAQ